MASSSAPGLRDDKSVPGFDGTDRGARMVLGGGLVLFLDHFLSSPAGTPSRFAWDLLRGFLDFSPGLDFPTHYIMGGRPLRDPLGSLHIPISLTMYNV
ncbi:hypothetical protein SLA2020_495450 [Shorea laevis]